MTGAGGGPRLTVAMPAFNEEQAIERAVREALATLDALTGEGEVLVVDDGSTDRTPAILEGLSRSDPRLRVVRNAVNSGIAVFNRRMLSEARGEWVLFIGADGEWDCREALRFLQKAESEGLDGVLGYRVSKRYSPWRHAVSWSFNTAVLLLFGARFRDIGGLRLLRRSRYAPLPLHSRSAFLNAERLLVGRRKGAVVAQVPVDHRPRFSGRGSGARPGRVWAAFRDLLLTRLRWFRFSRYYGS